MNSEVTLEQLARRAEGTVRCVAVGPVSERNDVIEVEEIIK